MITSACHCTRICCIASLISFLVWAAAARASEQKPIRFAFQDRIGSVIPIVAEEKGFFIAEGLRIKPMRFSSGPACAEALYSGAADIGGMGDTTAVILMARSNKFIMVASHAAGEHRHRVMVRKASGIRTLEDLKGKRIGVKKGTSTYGGLLAIFDQAEIDPAKVAMIDLTPATMTTALLAGSLDAFAASEPTPSIAEQEGAVQLTTLGGIGNQYPLLMLANRNIWLSQTDTADRFLRALKRAQEYATEHDDETVALISANTGLSAATTRRAMQRHDYRLRLDRTILSSLEQTAVFLKKQQIIDEIPDFHSTTRSGLME